MINSNHKIILDALSYYLSVHLVLIDMPTKQQLDKAAWQWAETTEPSDITNEHISTAYK